MKAPDRVRIAGGRFRGRFLGVPAGARPTGGRVREALFSIWADRLPGARLLELFAGSGAVACEAIGRGAGSAVAVDSSPAALRALGQNVSALGLGDEITVRRLDLPRDLSRLGGTFDLVFADPPYAFDEHAALLSAVEPRLAAEGEIVLEHGTRADPPPAVGSLELFDTRSYGESALARYRRG